MFPFISLWGIKVYMTGLGIVIALVVFIGVSRYFCRKYSIQFWRLFYRLPQAIILMYLGGSYVHFMLRVGLFPNSINDVFLLISPYGYKFHFIGIIVGITIALWLFFRKIQRIENKKLYSDVIFFASTAAIIPLGLFLLLGDDFIGKSTNSIRGVQALQSESALNKFSAVYPIGLFLSLAMTVLYIAMAIWKKITHKVGVGMLGLAYSLVIINIVILYQQYPRHGILPFGDYTLDIKQYVSVILVLIMLRTYKKRQRQK